MKSRFERSMGLVRCRTAIYEKQTVSFLTEGKLYVVRMRSKKYITVINNSGSSFKYESGYFET